jgi:hypothetical protein
VAKRKAKTKIDTGSYGYKRMAVRGRDGKLRYSTGNADAVAKAMLIHLADGGTVKQVVAANKLDVAPQGKRSDGLFRMAVGVVLRGLIRNGTAVKIGKLTVKSLKQKIALPKDDPKSATPRRKTKDKPVWRVRRRSVPKPAEIGLGLSYTL